MLDIMKVLAYFCLFHQAVVNGRGFTTQEVQDIVNAHNDYRVAERAANMLKMRWDPVLAEMAQQWSETCTVEHGNIDMANNFNYVGQNLYRSGAEKSDVTSMVTAWFNEKQYYNYADDSCSDVCGHYTQVVWADTYAVGCGYKSCDDGRSYYTCNYGPGGNYEGEQPYITGEACSKCDSESGWCNDGFCDENCSVARPECECELTCQNGATLNPTTCTCDCAPGWRSIDCTVPCGNYHKSCGASPGWPTSWCDRSYVIEGCPFMCDLCVSGGCSDGSAPPCSCDKECQNGGTEDVNECTCSCTPGWTGDQCEQPCGNFDERCGASPGWPASWCEESFVKTSCPLMCDVCVSGGCGDGSAPPCSCDKECQNGGTEDVNECICSCTAGWTGDECEKPCGNFHEYCGASPGWPTSWCGESFVKSNCPFMCGGCVSGGCSDGSAPPCSCDKECQKGGTEDVVECTCSCAPGWTGDECEKACGNFHEYCGGNPGWPTSWCDRSYVIDNCPKMCGLC